MSFFSKIVEKKGVVLAIVGATLAVGCALYFDLYSASTKATRMRARSNKVEGVLMMN